MQRIILFTLLSLVSVCAQAQTKVDKPANDQMQGMMRACSSLIDEITAARALNEQYKAEIQAAADQIAAEKAKEGAQLDKLNLLEQQVANLQGAIQKADEANKIRADEVTLLKAQLIAMTARYRLWRNVGIGAGGALVIGAIVAGSGK